MKNLSCLPFPLLAFIASSASALSNLAAPSEITADQPFSITYQNPSNAPSRIYLAAALANQSGPTCYLVNSTTLPATSLSLTIPPEVGPAGSYYSIAVGTLVPATSSSSSSLTSTTGLLFSNTFALSGTNATYSAYEDALHGAAFWNADALPCSAYACARACAQADYPGDLAAGSQAAAAMTRCMLACPGVQAAALPAATMTGSAGASSSSSSSAAASTAAVTSATATVPDLAVSVTEAAARATSSGAAVRGAAVAKVAVVGFAGVAMLL